MMRGLVSFLVAITFVFAGCMSPSNTPGPNDAADESGESPSPISSPVFDDPMLLGGDGTLEARLAIRGDDMLACMNGDFEDDAVYASIDAGATWQRLTIDRGSQGGSADCDLAISEGGTWYAIFMDTIPVPGLGTQATNGALVFGSSSDQGQTWTWTDIPTARTSGLADRPWLETVGESTVYLTHKSPSAGPVAVWFQKSDDRGATWSTPVRITSVPEQPAEFNAASGKMIIDATGETVYVPIHTWENDDTGLAGTEPRWLDLAVSRDAGATWELKPVMGPVQLQDGPHHNPSVAIADNQLYYAVPLHNESSRIDHTVVTSTDNGDTWSEPIMIAPAQDYPAGAQAYMSLEAGPNGTMDAAWHHWNEGWIVSMARFQEGQVLWASNITQAGGKAMAIEYIWLTHDDNGSVWIAYPVPEDPCPSDGDRDCLWIVRER